MVVLHGILLMKKIQFWFHNDKCDNQKAYYVGPFWGLLFLQGHLRNNEVFTGNILFSHQTIRANYVVITNDKSAGNIYIWL